MLERRKRPVNLNLFSIHLPFTAVVSILHRVSGVLLFLAIPLLLYCLQLSVNSEQSYLLLGLWLNSWPVTFVLLVALWALLHHFFAGIRFLLIDFDIGLTRSQARLSAAAVVFISLGLLFSLVLLP